jgi:hypothetical protein
MTAQFRRRVPSSARRTIVRFSQDIQVDLVELEKIIETELSKSRHGYDDSGSSVDEDVDSCIDLRLASW